MNDQNNNETNLNNNLNQTTTNNLNNINESPQALSQITNQSINSDTQQPENYPIPPINNQPQMQQYPQTTQVNNNEIDDTFVEPNKKPIGAIILLVLLLVIFGGMAYYYFVLDNPKAIFTTVVNTALDKINFEETKKSGTIDYNLNLNITSSNDEMKETLDIINQFKLSGSIGLDNNLNQLNGISALSSSFLSLIDNGDNPAMYAKLNDLYDKIIKIELEKDELTDYDTNINDYKQILSSIKNALTLSLENANYKKKIVKLNDETVKKISLNVDEEFLVSIYNKLLQDSLFVSSYSKIKGMSNEEVSDLLNKNITDAKGNDETLNLYLTAFKNEFLKFEYISDKNSLTITKNDDKYNFDISESYTSKYQGYIKLIEVNNKNNFVFSLSLIEEELNTEFNVEYSVDENKKVNTMDISNSVNLDELSEDETNIITNNLYENEAFNKLLEDFQKVTPTDDNSLAFSSDI